MSKDSLGDRMKEYENVPRTHLTRRTPVIIRIDGKAFHTWTRGLERPFSQDLHEVMGATARYLCENIQNAVLAYYQSDEISILLCDWKQHNTSAWFDNNIQKMVSVSASMATYAFNTNAAASNIPPEISKRPALFDSRVWNLPESEVVNYFIWRQQDATRNSVQMLARANFSHKELHGVSSSGLQDKLMLEKGINWNDEDTWKKRGACIIKKPFEMKGTPDEDGKDATYIRHKWVYDDEIPIFTQDRDYVSNTLVFD